ncbi:MAG TPA: hypothetical protein VH866_06840 [Candidatus Deferrimicrobiaceae bacterium]|jgi:hypothetical protein
MARSPSETSSRSPSSVSSATDRPGREAVLAAVFLLSAAALADEIFLIRLLSFRFWPHFVPLIVSQAMLGFGAAGLALHLLRRRIENAPTVFFAWLALLSAPSFDLAFRASQVISFDPFLLMWEPSAWIGFGWFFLLLAVPFFLAGGAIAVPFAFRFEEPGPVYAAAFAGSAAGAVLALPAFSFLGTESLMRVPLAIALAASLFAAGLFGGRMYRSRLAVLAASSLLLFLPPAELALSPYKDLAVAARLPGAETIAYRFGPSGDYRALFASGIHVAPGLSFRFAGEIPPQAALFFDGEARGVVPQDGGESPPAYLDGFPLVAAYRMVDRPAVLQFGLRGTEGILTAARNGASSVTVVEPAAELAALVRSDLFRFSAGLPAEMPAEIRTEGARNFLAREGGRFDLIEVSEISSATYSSLGIHATGETYLLTREGIRAAMSRLTESGVIAFSGWLKAPPRESVKILATLRLELERDDRAPASAKVVMVRGWGSFAIIARRLPFAAEEMRRLERFCGETGFSIVWPPGDGPEAGEGAAEKGLRTAVAGVIAGRSGGPGAELFDLLPVVDDSPYFHRFLRLGSLPEFRRLLGNQWVPFVEWGVVFLLASLAVSLALASVCLLAPLAAVRLPDKAGGASLAVYFSALGLAYMLIELTFLKIGILLLGDAIRAATAAIGGFAFFSGLGSAISGRWGSEKTMKGRVFPGIAFLALAGFLFLSLSAGVLLPLGETARTAIFIVSLGPAAFLMGMPFPAGLSRLAGSAAPAIPYAWGINGFFSVAGASLASAGAMWIGFRGTVAAGGLLYLAAGWLFSRVGKSHRY